MKLSKRILSVLLALTMLLSLCPLSLFAGAEEGEGVHYEPAQTVAPGDRLIVAAVYQDVFYAMANDTATTANALAAVELPFADGQPLPGEADLIWTVASGSQEGTFLLKNSAGQAISYGGSGSALSLSDAGADLRITPGEGSAVLEYAGNATRRIFFRMNNGVPQFRMYSTNNLEASGYSAVLTLYKVIEPSANIAPKATAASATCASWNKVSGVNDGDVPTQSQGSYSNVYGSWGQNAACDPEYITLSWATEVELEGAGLYFWHDNGKDNRSGIDFPAAYSLEYLDADGVTWLPVPEPAGLAVDEDVMNKTAFGKISTTALRVVLEKESAEDNSYGLGVAEFEAYGWLTALDTSVLEAAIAQAEAIGNLNNYTDESLAAFQEALAAAKAVLENPVNQANVDAAAAALKAAIAGLTIKPVDKPAEENIAPQGTASASYCAGWNSVAGVNDGAVPTQSQGNQAGAYGSWGQNNNANPEPITISFEQEAVITGAGMYFWTDQDDPFNQSGINFPASYSFEYLDGEEWKSVENALGMNNQADEMNYSVFEPVTTTALRVMLVKASTGSYGLGVAEFEIYGSFQGGETEVDKSALAAAVSEAEALDQSLYTDESLAAFREALAAAQAVLADENADQAQVDAALAALQAAVAALVEKPQEQELPVYELVTDLSQLKEGERYVITLWRYFAGTNADSVKGYVFGASAACGGVRADTADNYATITYDQGAYPDTALWSIVPVEGGYSLQNLGTGKYLGSAIPADSDEPVSLKIVSGEVNGVNNYAIGTDSTVIRYSGSADSFSFYARTPESQVTATNACNALIHRVVTQTEPAAETVQFFAGSDIQSSSSQGIRWDAYLDGIARSAYEAGAEIDISFWAGDYADGSVYADGSDTSATETPARIQYIKDTLGTYWSDVEFYFAQGNHDGSQHIGTVLDETGPKEYDDFILYQINEDDFPWWQAGYSSYSSEDTCLEKINATTETLGAYLDGLIAAEDQRVVFIYTHVPLHWSSRSTTMNSWWSDNIHADILFNMINEKAENLDIVFLYGHNHSENYADAYPDGGTVNFFAPGDEIRIPNGQVAASGNYTVETIKFTYLNAGYVGATAAGFSPSVSTASVITLSPEKVEFTRYTSTGHYEGSDRTLIRNNRGEYPAYLQLASLDNPKVRNEGDSEQFRGTLKNAEAASWTWSVEGPAEISEGQGSDTVTLTYTGGGDVAVKLSVSYSDGEGQTQSLEQTMTVSVKAAPEAEGVRYEELSSIADFAEGKQYAVVAWRYFGEGSDEACNGYVFQAENNGSLRAPTTDGYATISPEAELPDKALWYIVPVEGGITMQNVATGKYLADAIPAASDEPYTLTVAEGSCNDTYNIAIGTASGSIRYSNSSGAFSYSTTAPSGEVSRAWAANLTVYEKVVPVVHPNIAPKGTASSDFCASWSSVAGVNDGVIPESSNPGYDYNEAYGSWGKNANSEPETILISFDRPAKLYGAGAFFWYNADGPHNQNGIDIPASYVWEYQNAAGEWVSFPNAQGMGIEEDVMNQTVFDPVVTSVVRINMAKSTTGSYGLGVAELELYGELLEPVDTTALEAAIAAAEAVESDKYTEDSVAALNEALAAAKAVLEDPEKTQQAVDEATAALEAALAALAEKPKPNIAPQASAVEAPYCASWNNLAGVYDEVLPSASNTAGDNTAYGSWRSNGTADPEYITFTFDRAAEISSASAYFLYNENSPHEQFGIDFPDSYTFEYRNDAGNWVEVPNASGYGLEEDVLNLTSFEPVVTTAFRIVMQRQAGAFGLGVGEIMIFGEFVSVYVDKTELAAAIAEAEALTESDWTPESWAALAEALEAGKAVFENPEASQEEVDAAAAALRAAIEALVDKVQVVIELIDALPEPITLEDLEALEEAREAYEALTEEQKERVSNYQDLLLAEIEYYELAAEQALQEAIEAAIEALKEYEAHAAAGHDDEHVAAAEEALAEAIAALLEAEDSEALQAAVEAGIEAINEALAGGEHDCKIAHFVDLEQYPVGSPVHEAIEWAFTHDPQITSGTDETHFTPEKELDRKTAMTFLYAAAGKPEFDVDSAEKTFSDVKPGKWYTKAILWAANQDPAITAGNTDGSFGINTVCKTSHMLTFLYAQQGKPEFDESAVPEGYVAEGKWYTAAAKWAYAEGIYRAEGDKFVQSVPCTRATTVLYLYRALTGQGLAD